MFARERQDAIVALVSQRGRVTVSELAENFHVTPDCIRKDLRRLDGEGMLRRVYGGATSIATAPEHDLRGRLSVRLEQKRAIALKAYEQIVDGETIFIDISTTTLALARLLAQSHRHCVVVSNGIDALQALCANEGLTVIGTGGNVNREFNGFLGAATLAMLEPISFDKAFFGALGIDLAQGSVSTFDMDDRLVKQTVMRNSAHRFLLADSSKFGVRGTYRYASPQEFDAVFMEREDPKLRALAKVKGARLA